MKILVTGGSGNVGRLLVQELLDQGHDVVSFDVKEPQKPTQAHVVVGNLASQDDVDHAMQGCDAVCHLGAVPAPVPYEYWRALINANTVGTFNIFDAAKRLGIKKVIYASSICAGGWYPNWEKPPQYYPVDEEHPVAVVEPYGLSKLFGEQLGRIYADMFDMQILCLRLANVMMHVESDGAKALESEVIWTKVDRRDVTQAFRAALESDVRFGIYHIGSRYIYDAAGEKHTPESLQQAIEKWGVREVRDADYVTQMGPFISSRRAMSEIGYAPQF